MKRVMIFKGADFIASAKFDTPDEAREFYDKNKNTGAYSFKLAP